MELKGSRTEANLMAAFAGESQARNKYTFYESQARKDGFVQIAEIFKETADNEKEHAEIWFKVLHNDSIPNTLANLKDGVAGEHYEWSEMYKEFAKVAREEGFERIAYLFEGVGAIEKEHEERYQALASNMEDNLVFRKPESVVWICSNCGHIHIGESAPEKCPVCDHARAYFKIKADNY